MATDIHTCPRCHFIKLPWVDHEPITTDGHEGCRTSESRSAATDDWPFGQVKGEQQ